MMPPGKSLPPEESLSGDTLPAKRPYRPYRDELWRVFVVYALTPVIFLAVVGYALLVFWGYRLIEIRTRDNAEHVAALLGEELTAYRKGLDELAADGRFLAVLNDTGALSAEETALRVALYGKLYGVVAERRVKGTFHVFGPQGQPVMSDTHSLPHYAEDLPGNGMSWGIFRDMNRAPHKAALAVVRSSSTLRGPSVVTLGRAVTGPEGDIRGYVLYDLLESDLAALLHRPEGGEVVMTDRFHNVAVTTSRDFLDEFSKLREGFRMGEGYVRRGGETWFVGQANEPEGELNIHGITASNYFRDIAWKGAFFLTVVFGGVITLILVWGKRIAVRKTRAVEALVDIIQHKDPNLPLPDKRMYLESNNEFRVILRAFTSMLADNRRLMDQHQEELRRAMRAEIKQLESQFNPHLLYNTLETVRCMVKLDPTAANNIIVKLSSLLRYSIDNRTSQVPLDADMAHMRNYLDILKYRFSERFDYEVAMDDAAGACLVPKLILQPLVENAVEHGFGSRESLRVWVRARVENGHLHIAIEDNGQGMDEARLCSLRDMLGESTNPSNYIGLYNAHRRIVLMHGQGFGLDIESRHRQGTVVRLTLPALRDTHAEDPHC